MRLEKYVEEFSKILEAVQGKEWSAEVDEAEVSLAILREVAKDKRLQALE